MKSSTIILVLCILIASVLTQSTYAADLQGFQTAEISDEAPSQYNEFSDEYLGEVLVNPLACTKASASQINFVNQGNLKKEALLQACFRETGGSAWCAQLIRPNPSSISAFRCTYGVKQVHQLIHPDESTWKNAIGAVRLIQELEQKGLRVCQIYNWWRPEPYNRNVGGAAGRHPNGTSIDVRFCSNADANRAFTELCKIRKQGRIRAIGHYGTSALHFGVGDRNGNTWGRSCP